MDLITRKDDERLDWLMVAFRSPETVVIYKEDREWVTLILDSLRAMIVDRAALLKRAEDAEENNKWLRNELSDATVSLAKKHELAYRAEWQLCITKDAFQRIIEYWNGSSNLKAMEDALEEIIKTATAALSLSTPCPHAERVKVLEEAVEWMGNSLNWIESDNGYEMKRPGGGGRSGIMLISKTLTPWAYINKVLGLRRAEGGGGGEMIVTVWGNCDTHFGKSELDGCPICIIAAKDLEIKRLREALDSACDWIATQDKARGNEFRRAGGK